MVGRRSGAGADAEQGIEGGVPHSAPVEPSASWFCSCGAEMPLECVAIKTARIPEKLRISAGCDGVTAQEQASGDEGAIWTA